MDTSYEGILSMCERWAHKHLGSMFKFRENQKECIAGIIKSWISGNENYILSAPTGSGKSIISIVVAGVLNEFFGKRGHILISDLSLLSQYDDFVSKYVPEWCIIKGQSNYTCAINGLNYKLGECHRKKNKKFDCRDGCEYISTICKYQSSDVSICTYAFWIIRMNNKDLYDKTKNDFVICDECHRIPSIIQGHFSPSVGLKDIDEFNVLFSMLPSNVLVEHFKKFRNSVKCVIEELYDKKDIFNRIEEYSIILSDSLKSVESYINDNDETDIDVYKKVQWLRNKSIMFSEYVNMIKETGVKSIVRTVSEKSGIVTFNCLDERYIIRDKFLSKSEKRLFMSATIGNVSTYSEEMSIDSYDYFELPNTFDYSESPIYYIPGYKMSFSKKEDNFKYIVAMIGSIVLMYSNLRGIIQTGNYEFAERLYNESSDEVKSRMILYEDSKDKIESLSIYKYSKDKILVGPTLTEGLSLDDDMCRFQIIMKVPYPSIADSFVSEKMNQIPGWYESATAISIMQGVGRGIRNPKDWCATFILDGCFTSLACGEYGPFSKEFIDRIIVVDSKYLIPENFIQ